MGAAVTARTTAAGAAGFLGSGGARQRVVEVEVILFGDLHAAIDRVSFRLFLRLDAGELTHEEKRDDKTRDKPDRQ